jgi:hypothetical protein
MLRTLLLLLLFATVYALGIAIAVAFYRGRAAQTKAWAEILEVRHALADSLMDQVRRGARLGTATVEPPPEEPMRRPPGQHRRRVRLDAPERPFIVPKPPKLRTLEDQITNNITAEAQRVQERRRFVDFMTEVTGEQHPVGRARVLVAA